MPRDYSTLRVLLIDDQPASRQYLRAVLGGVGIEAVTDAADASAALEAVTARGARFDLILCDLRMPGRDGIEVIRMLAGLRLGCAVAILSVETERVVESAGQLAALRGLNFVGAVQKPLTEEKLEALLEAVAPEDPDGAPPRPTAAEIWHALATGEIEPSYEPDIAMRTGACIGAVAAPRWPHPSRGVMDADVLLPACEASPALLSQLTLQTLRDALAACGRWQADRRELGVTVDVSPLAVAQLDFPDTLAELAQNAHVVPNAVTLAIRESVLGTAPTVLFDVVSRLRLKGFQVALASFSGQHAPLQQMLAMPFTAIHIDAATVDGCAESPAKRSVVEAGLALARHLQLTSVAAGVASLADWDLLAAAGCEAARGPCIGGQMTEPALTLWAGRSAHHPTPLPRG